MYSRIITKPPTKILKKGIPQFGSYFEPPKSFDITSLKQPFTLFPLPQFLTKIRIRGNIEFFFNTDNYVGTIDILDAGIFSFAETNFWGKSNGKKLSYRCLIPLRKIIPHHLNKGQCYNFRKKRYFKMTWNHEEKTFSFVFHYEGDSIRPDATGVFTSQTPSKWGMLTSINPFPLKNRCSAEHVSAMPIKTSLSTSFTTNTIAADESNGQSLFSFRWAFYSLRTKDHSITGFGEWNEKKIIFKLFCTSKDPLDKNTYNENVLFVDGEITPLAPVIITRPKGLLGPWIIQDTESMVDITFTPTTDTKRTLSILLLRTEYHTMWGKGEGNLLTKDGQKIPLKNFTLIAKQHSLRL